MRRSIVSAFSFCTVLSIGIPATGQTPNGPVFTITLEQKGTADGETMQKNIEARYWPCTMWNSGYYGGLTVNEQAVLGSQVKATPEGLLVARGSIAGMKPGEVLLFYVREKSGSGKAGDCSNEVSTIGDGIFRCIIREGDNVTTHNTGDPGNNKYSRTFGPGGNTNAILKRTPEGAVLTFSEPFLEGEGYCDFFGLFEGNNVPEDWPEVTTFTFTNDDLKNWPSMLKINDRTLNGPEGGSLHVRATLHGGTLSYTETEVIINGCSELGVGEQVQVTAIGKPEGGRYRYWAEPTGMMIIESDGTSATLNGSSPGRGTLFVEYTSPEGKTTQASQPATCSKIESYNNGQPIPQVAFYDFDGKRLKGINVPVSMQPSDGADLLKYVPADPAILTVIGLGNEVMIQGIREGKTTFQATTPCGGTTGPTVDVEVVNCDDETIAKLNEQARIANERLKELTQEMERMVNSDEYKRAHSRILESTANLALKTSGLIIGTVGGAPGADKAVKTASEIFGRGSALLDMLRSGSTGEAAINAAKMAIELFGNNIMQIASGASETYDAANDFADDLGEMEKAAQKTADIYNSLDQLNRFIDNLAYRMRLCAGGPEQETGKEEPPGEPSQTRKDPTPKTGKPSNKEPKVEEPISEVPAVEEPTEKETGEDGTEISHPPASEPRQVGLPYMPAECGCSTSKSIGISQEGFSSLQTGMKNLGKCVDNFSVGPLTDYIKTLEEWQSVTDSLATFVNSGAAGLQLAAKETIPHIESLLQRTQSFDEAGKAFIGDFNKCSESMNSIMEVLRTAETITIDSITTKY